MHAADEPREAGHEGFFGRRAALRGRRGALAFGLADEAVIAEDDEQGPIGQRLRVAGDRLRDLAGDRVESLRQPRSVLPEASLDDVQLEQIARTDAHAAKRRCAAAARDR